MATVFRASALRRDDLMTSKKPNDQGIERFWHLLENMKQQKRRGWMEKLGMRNAESVAEHSYAVAMLSLFEAARRGSGYDRKQLLELALIHDLEESLTGDFTPKDKRKLGSREVLRRRNVAQREILAVIPSAARSGWVKRWTDLRLRRTREARLVKEMDLLEMALQARAYGEARPADKSGVREFYRSAENGIGNARLRKLVHVLGEGSPVTKKKVRR